MRSLQRVRQAARQRCRRARKISTTCTACHKGMVANVSVTGGAGQTEQQSGRADTRPVGEQAQNGGLCDVKCMCMPSRRRLLVGTRSRRSASLSTMGRRSSTSGRGERRRERQVLQFWCCGEM